MCLARILATNSVGFCRKIHAWPACLLRLRWYDSSEKGIDGSRSSVEFAVICIESITSLCWGGSSRAAIPGVCLALLQGSCSRKSFGVGIVASVAVVLG